MEREAKLFGDPLMAEAASTMRETELKLVNQADATIVVSEYESSLLRKLTPLARVHQIPILRGATPVPEGDWADRRDFLFIGGFEHGPNVDAVVWFVGEVWPKLQAMGYSDFLPSLVPTLLPGSMTWRATGSSYAVTSGTCRLCSENTALASHLYATEAASKAKL